MAGRHSSRETGHRARTRSRRRALPFVLVPLVAAGLGIGGVVMVGSASDEAAGCSRTLPVRLAAAPEIAPVLDGVAGNLEGDKTVVDGACVDFQVEAATPEKVAEAVSAESDSVPDLWVPDFSVWLTRVEQSGGSAETVNESLAKSPVVVVGKDAKAPESWREVGMKTVAYLDPLNSSASTAALLSAFGEMAVTGASKTEMGAMMVPLAQRYGAQADKPTKIADVAQAAQQGALGVMTEQQLVDAQHRGTAVGLSAQIPQSGTMVLDYPLASLSSDQAVQLAGRRLAEYMTDGDGTRLLAAHGFRTPDNAPLASGEGLGDTEVKVLPSPDAQDVTGALRQWSVLTVPSRSLAVVDVSGSMDFTAGRRTRISLAVEAAQQALQLFPDNSALGLWAFSVKLGGPKLDYKQLVPIRSLGSQTAGVSQRDALGAALEKLPEMTNGGTGLYDTTLAALRTVQDGYDTRAVNTVILLTDGQNDDPGSLSLKELLRAIERERDPARPVPVIAIGMGPDADAKALERIAAATRGHSYVARNPADISAVFIDAMLSR